MAILCVFRQGDSKCTFTETASTKASSNLTVGHGFPQVIRRTFPCFADLSHGFNRDIFIPGHFGKDIAADTAAFLRSFFFISRSIGNFRRFLSLISIPSASIPTGFPRKTGAVGLVCLEYSSIFFAKTQRFIKRRIEYLVFGCFLWGEKIRHDDRGLLSA